MDSEARAVEERYSRRDGLAGLYNPLLPSVYLAQQERHRAIVECLVRLEPLADRTLLEVGCGMGANLLEMLLIGFRPENLIGNELLPDRAAEARRRLPDAVSIIEGDARTVNFGNEQFDVVLQSTVFSSILDPSVRADLASTMWRLVRPGGAVLWYDFAFDNPRNPDVRGVSVSEVRSLFPQGVMLRRNVTLAPPISRRVTRIHPALYGLFNAFPFLRTHRLCWIVKS
jgi:SAM-dependent methyltransferase